MRPRAFLLIACETGLIIAAVWLAAYVRFGNWMWNVMAEQNGMPKALLIAAVCQMCLYYSDLYDFRKIGDRKELLVRIIQALGGASFVLAAVYYWFPASMIGRGVFFLSAGFVTVLVSGWRVAFEWLSSHVGPRQRLLLVGIGSAAIKLERELMDRRQALGVDIVGFIDADPTAAERPKDGVRVIGRIEDIPAIVKSLGVDRVVVSLADARGKLPMDKLLEMKLQGVTFDHLASVYEEFTGKIAVENLRPSWLIFSSGFHDTRARRAAKRAIDVTAAVCGLLIAAPVMLIVAALVRVTSPGPVLFRQTRVGQNGRLFTLYQVPLDACRRRSADRARMGTAGRRARHTDRQDASDEQARRAAAVVERPDRRDEPCRPPARAAGIRRTTEPADSFLRSTPFGATRCDRMGTGSVQVRGDDGRRA